MRNAPGLPDPALRPEFYDGTLPRRLAAWVIDTTVSAIVAAALLPFTLFLGLLVFPAMIMVVSFFYRWATIAAFSATPGMALLGLQLRGPGFHRLDGAQAFWHTAGYTLSFLINPLQWVSIAMMILSPRRQGLTDHLMGTALVNRPLA